MDVLHQHQQQQYEEEELLDVDQNQRRSVMMMMMKGKRSKRSRQVSPVSSSSNNYYSHSVSSPTTSSSEDEDMANCLILLAQGRLIHSQDKDKPVNNNIMVPLPPAAVAAGSIVEVYECKTCNRTFQSFQALGGHRASHKKPKITPPPLSTTLLEHVHVHVHDHVHVREMEQEAVAADNNKERVMSMIISNNMSSKVHECSICGAEFSSGQALGGHMRRHRAPQAPVVKGQTMMMMNNYSNELHEHHHHHHQNEKKNLLGLDLNLPAPMDQEDNKFQFLSSNMVFSSAPALVYCHY